MEVKRTFYPWFILPFLFMLLVAYKFIDPSANVYFRKCPFLQLTGYVCPGCGSQRAIHHLLNYNLIQAYMENPMLVLSIPYLAMGFIYNLIKEPSAEVLKWRKRFFGHRIIYILLFLIVAFGIFRNL